MSEKLLTTIVEKLGVDPCMLSMVLIVSGSYLLIRYTYSHHEKMEEKRIEQFQKMVEMFKSGAQNGSN